MTNIAFVGVGHIHAPNFINKTLERTGLKATRVWDHDAERAKLRAEKLGAEVSELQAIIDDASITAAVICSETNLHAEVVEPLAKAGKDLFVEKPLGMFADDAFAMARHIEQAGVKFQTGYFMRGLPAMQWFKQQVDAGTFGTITRMRASNCHGGSLGGLFDNEWRWMADPVQAGCGAFGDLGTHVLDLLLWLGGPVIAATAQIDDVTARYADCDESGEGLMRFKSGAMATLAGGWVDHVDPVRFQVSGTEAHATIIRDQLFCYSKKLELNYKAPVELPEGQPAGFDAFLDAVEGKPATLVGAREAAYRSAVMEAMYTGARELRFVAPRSF